MLNNWWSKDSEEKRERGHFKFCTKLCRFLFISGRDEGREGLGVYICVYNAVTKIFSYSSLQEKKILELQSL